MRCALAEINATLRRQSWLLAANISLSMAVLGVLLVQG